MLADKLNLVKKNIEEACDTAGRSPQEVTLIAVSKTKPVEMLKEAYDAGARVFGENKVQEIVDKYDQMPSDVQWHMIGHLQRNKVKYIIDKVELIHSVNVQSYANVPVLKYSHIYHTVPVHNFLHIQAVLSLKVPQYQREVSSYLPQQA